MGCHFSSPGSPSIWILISLRVRAVGIGKLSKECQVIKWRPLKYWKVGSGVHCSKDKIKTGLQKTKAPYTSEHLFLAQFWTSLSDAVTHLSRSKTQRFSNNLPSEPQISESSLNSSAAQVSFLVWHLSVKVEMTALEKTNRGDKRTNGNEDYFPPVEGKMIFLNPNHD